jgi:diguanylate cyclase
VARRPSSVHERSTRPRNQGCDRRTLRDLPAGAADAAACALKGAQLGRAFTAWTEGQYEFADNERPASSAPAPSSGVPLYASSSPKCKHETVGSDNGTFAPARRSPLIRRNGRERYVALSLPVCIGTRRGNRSIGADARQHCPKSYIVKTSSNMKKSLPASATKPQSLKSVLSQSERIKESVTECAEELASVNGGLKQVLAAHDPLPIIEGAIEKSVAVEDKVQEASADLSVVNVALENEINERHILEHQLAAVAQQGDVARHASLHDALTGLPNRVLLNDRLEHGLAQAKRHNRTLAVMFLDLDDFKKINDSHGHDTGDSVLKTIAERLANNTRSDDTMSRHGGDEFLCVLTEVSDEHAVALIAAKLINIILAPCQIRVHDLTISLSVKASIGISLFPIDGTTADVLIARADKAMYLAKKNGSGYLFARETDSTIAPEPGSPPVASPT